MAQGMSRGRFIRIGAAMGATSAFAISCGSGGGSSDNGEAPAPEEAPEEASSPEESVSEEAATEESVSEEAASGGESIASESDVAAGEALDFENDGEPAVLVHLESGDFVAYSAVCTHAQCTVAFNGGSLDCPCHGSAFDPANGAEVTAGPAPEPLTEIPVEVRDGEVFLA